MVIKNVLLATEAGPRQRRTPIFPIHIFKGQGGVNYNPGDPNYDLFKLACRVSAKRLSPTSPLSIPPSIRLTRSGAIRRPRSPTWAAAPASSPTARSHAGDRQRPRQSELYFHQPPPGWPS